MATRGTIMLAIPKEAKGKTYNYIKSGKEKVCFNYPTPSVTIPEEAEYVSVYHHFDSYPTGLGKEILEDFAGKDFDYIMEHLIAGGELSSTYIPYHAWRNDDWEYAKPKFSDEPFPISEEYQYFRDTDGKWFVRGEYRLKEWKEIGEWVLTDEP